MIPTISGRVFVASTSCFGSLKFRLYLGHLALRAIHVKIRHPTEKEIRYGLSFWSRRRYFPAYLKEQFGFSRTMILINKASLFKRFMQVGCLKQDILAYFLGSQLDHFGLVFVKNHQARWISAQAFDSHGPLC
jgi:hypothetical protein